MSNHEILISDIKEYMLGGILAVCMDMFLISVTTFFLYKVNVS